MKNRIRKSTAVLLALVFLTGCSNAIPEMNEEQQKLVVEYAAGVLLQNDEKHTLKLQPDLLARMEQEQLAKEQNNEPEASALEQEQEPEPEEKKEDGTVIIDNLEGGVSENISIEQFLNIEDFTFSYVGYEAVPSYPEQTPGETLFFAMNATEGNELLVLKFTAQNITSEEKLLDMVGTGVRFKIQLDGEQKNALTTMLLNDMTYFQGNVGPGESAELVLVCELPVGTADTIGEITLVMKSADNTAAISLV